ncbi:MAG: HAD family phosphatase [bacterium]|nr:HAD family phosphatase [bacterium]
MIKIYPDIKGLIFDCDGTLVDTMPLHLKAWKRAFSEFGVSGPEEFLDPLKGMHEEEIVNLYNKQYGTDINSRLLVEKKHIHYRNMIDDVKPIEQVVSVAKKYYDILPMAVVSGGKEKNVHAVLEKAGIKHYFSVILTADDPVKPKPAPDIFLEAAARIKVDPRFCQIFEDGDPGLKAAKDAGMVITDIRKYIS